jgi:hypothetical protein
MRPTVRQERHESSKQMSDEPLLHIQSTDACVCMNECACVWCPCNAMKDAKVETTTTGDSLCKY